MHIEPVAQLRHPYQNQLIAWAASLSEQANWMESERWAHKAMTGKQGRFSPEDVLSKGPTYASLVSGTDEYDNPGAKWY
jgi:hypothetical protein